MAYGDIKLFTVQWTSASVASLYKNYPVKKKFKQSIVTNTPEYPNSYTLYSNQKYWFPFQDISTWEANYIEYTDGDEFTFDIEKYARAAEAAKPQPNKQSVSAIATGTRVIFANDIYQSLDKIFKWQDTGFPESKNPYDSEKIPLWKRISDTSLTPVYFWYHPLLRRFFPIGQKYVDSTAIPIVKEFDNSKWDSFTGDATEINLENFTIRQIQELVSTGVPFPGATQVIENLNSSTMRSMTGEKIPGSWSLDGRFLKQSPDDAEQYDSDDGMGSSRTTTVRVTRRVGTGILGGGKSLGEFGSFSIDKPQMIQYYTKKDGSTASAPDRFVFDYRPNNVTYSNLGSEWTEIERINNTPYIDFKNFRLMKINFEFVVGDAGNLYSSVDNKLKLLRTMSMRPSPVTFLGFDAMFQEQIVIPNMTGGSGIVFAIVDMQITSAQRSRPGDGSSPPNQGDAPPGSINRATVSMTIQELPLEGPNLIVMPRPPKDIPQVPPPPTNTDEPCVNLWTTDTTPGPLGQPQTDCKPKAK
jgi:hypothetical protein